MSGSKQDDAARDKRVLLGQRCVTVHHGMLWVDERIAGILGLSENQVLPDPVADDDDEDEEKPGEDRAKRPTVVLTPIVRVRPSRRGLLWITGVLAFFLVVWGIQARRLWSRTEPIPAVIAAPAAVEPGPPEPSRKTAPPVHVLRGADGQPVEIRAAAPDRVLDSFCALADPALVRTALGVAPATPPDPSLVVGRFEDRGVGGTPQELLIYLDPRTSLWSSAIR